MKRFLFTALSLVAFAPLACSDESPAPETREGFCDRWGQAACSADVVSACQAASADDCRLAQEEFCLDLVPVTGFAPNQADACINAVRSAYSDADLTADELDTVLRLGPPCNRLVRGPREAGETCTSSADCNAPEGYECVIKGSMGTGTCQQPEVVEAGRDCSADEAVCTEGFFCDGENCVEGAAAGEACVINEQCAEGYCADTDVCSPGLDVNAACTTDDQCASGICYQFSDTERVCTDRVRLSRTDPLCDVSR